jgi:hypothetical protein
MMFSWLGRRIILTRLRAELRARDPAEAMRMVDPRYPTESENSAEWTTAFI